MKKEIHEIAVGDLVAGEWDQVVLDFNPFGPVIIIEKPMPLDARWWYGIVLYNDGKIDFYHFDECEDAEVL